MTVALNTEANVEYPGVGTINQFDIPFPTFENSNIVAEVLVIATNDTIDLEIGTDFTLSNIGRISPKLTLVNAGQVWLISGNLKTGYKLIIRFNKNAAQPMKGREWGAFAPEIFEKTLDRLCMAIIAVKEFTTELFDRIVVAEADIVSLEETTVELQEEIDALEIATTKYWGDPSTNGSWRERINADGDLVLEVRTAGVWVLRRTTTTSAT